MYIFGVLEVSFDPYHMNSTRHIWQFLRSRTLFGTFSDFFILYIAIQNIQVDLLNYICGFSKHANNH